MQNSAKDNSKTDTQRSQKMGVVSGKITVEQSGVGVANLIIEVLSVTENVSSQRLGSVCTDSQGLFRIDVSLPEPQQFLWYNRSSRWNLQLLVLAPERNTLSRNERVLFSSDIRKHAGPNEQFRIEVPDETLKAVGVDPQETEKTNAELFADGIIATASQAEEVQNATDQVFSSKLGNVTTGKTFFRTEVRSRLSQDLSSVSEKERESDRFVPNDHDIELKYLASVKTDIHTLTEKEPDADTGELMSKVRFKSRFLLTDDERSSLMSGDTEPQILDEEAIEEKLGVVLDKPATIYQQHLEPDPCRPKTDAEQCLDDITHETSENEDENLEVENLTESPSVPSEGSEVDSNGNLGGTNVTFDKNAAIARLMESQRSPEDKIAHGFLESPLTAKSVSDAINKVEFAPGPADVPAFYDFHDLQIAFEPVWQEALDDKFLNDVEKVYDQIVERGGAPARDRVKDLLTTNLSSSFFHSLLDCVRDISIAINSEVPAQVASVVLISLEEWRGLPLNLRDYLFSIAARIADLREKLIAALDPEDLPSVSILNIRDLILAANTRDSIAFRSQIQLLTADADRIVAHARRLLLERDAHAPFKPTHEIIKQLKEARSRAYPFRYFAASPQYQSVNFGLMVTYRQKWTPVSYQVGELVSTIPLAPKEIRKFTKKTVVKTTRARKEIESNIASRREESEQKTRAEAEIVARATAQTNFTLSNSGTVKFGGEGLPGGSSTTTSSFSRNVEKHSQSIKKEFRESILKSAEEYKNERKVEVSTEERLETEATESGEIQNPNDEIPVTFMFYELQRRFKVAEKLHRLQSVVLVAQEVPNASAIDKAWLIRYDWILNRVLLDDSFRPALTYVSTTLVSEDVVLQETRQCLIRHRTLVEELKEDVADRRALSGLRYAALQRQIERTAQSADSGGGGLLGGLGDLVSGVPLVGGLVQGGIDLITGGREGDTEEAQIREGAARDAYDRERQEEQELASRLKNALSTLQVMERDYTERLGQHLRQLAQCERLIAHIAQNILYYMQAIWSYEPDDQRFLRLRNIPVPVFVKDKKARRYVVNPIPMKAFHGIPRPNAREYEAELDLGIASPPASPSEIKTKPLSEVADLNRVLGFKGNYMMFPMLESNPITEFMMDPYVTFAEGEYGISDPDPLGNMTLDEFSEYVCCLKRHFEKQQEGDSYVGSEEGNNSFDKLKPYLRDTLKKLLERSLRQNEEIVVPCDCLYIEALPGAHSVMEQFKQLHRQIDVKAAQEDVRREALENVRRAARILDDQLEDPDIESKYVFEGDGTATIVPPGGGDVPSSEDDSI